MQASRTSFTATRSVFTAARAAKTGAAISDAAAVSADDTKLRSKVLEARGDLADCQFEVTQEALRKTGNRIGA